MRTIFAVKVPSSAASKSDASLLITALMALVTIFFDSGGGFAARESPAGSAALRTRWRKIM